MTAPSKRDVKVISFTKLLHELYKELSDGPKKLSIGKILKQNKLPDFLSKFMIDYGLINKTNSGNGTVWTWNDASVKPTEKIASEIYKMLEDNWQAYKEKVGKTIKTKKDKTIIVKEESKPSINISEQAKKIKSFLDSVYDVLKDAKEPISNKSVSLYDIISKHELPKKIVNVIVIENIIEQTGSGNRLFYKWIGNKPSIDMAIEVNQRYVQIIADANLLASAKYKNKKASITKNKSSENKSESNIEIYNHPITILEKSDVKTMVSLAKKFVEFGEFQTALDVMNKA